MEADWEVELGGDAPAIEPRWAGFVDLRSAFAQVERLDEVKKFPALGPVLLRLNHRNAQVWTAKCDFWPKLEEGNWDPFELDAPAEEAVCAAGCYIDLLPAGSLWAEVPAAEAACRRWSAALEKRPLRCGRVDLIVRRVWMKEDWAGLGATAYLTACGKSEAAASERLAVALAIFADVLNPESTIE
jgi:hypothetical protein